MLLIKLYTSIVLLLISLLGYGQVVVFEERYYSDGTIQEKFQAYTENGDTIKRGPYYFYYPEGTIMQEGYYIDNMPDSLWTNYYRNGFRQSMYRYSKGKKSGQFKIWKDDGSLFQSGTYRNGLLKDKLVTYHPQTEILIRKVITLMVS